MSLMGAVYTLLNDTTDITDYLSTYNFGGGAIPAIFSEDPAPDNAECPLITIEMEGGAGGASVRDRGNRGGNVGFGIKLWYDKDHSQKEMREVAETIWKTLDRADLTLSGYEFVQCLSTPPGQLSDPDGFRGFLIRCVVSVRYV